jgi:hypothetical protein
MHASLRSMVYSDKRWLSTPEDPCYATAPRGQKTSKNKNLVHIIPVM